MHREWAGNASENLCRKCVEIRKLDPLKDRIRCLKYKDADLVDIMSLPGTRCIRCEGTFQEGDMTAVS